MALIHNIRDAFIAVAGDISELYRRLSHGGTFYAVSYGVRADTGTDQRSGVQAAIDAAAAAGGGVVVLPAGVIDVAGSTASTFSGRTASLFLKAGVTLRGAGMYATTIRQMDGANSDVIITDRVTPLVKDVAIEDLTIDGNSPNQDPARPEGFNIWINSVEGLRLRGVRSVDPAAFGIRIEKCRRVLCSEVSANHAAASNADGVHFLDTSQVVVTGMDIVTRGDDGFIITAAGESVSNYSVKGLVVRAQQDTLSAGFRGVLINLSDAQTTQHLISNIDIDATVYDCTGPALNLSRGDYKNIRARITAVNTGKGIVLLPGNDTSTGHILGCDFDILADATVDAPVHIMAIYGNVVDSRIKATARNCAPSLPQVLLSGTRLDVDVKTSNTGSTTASVAAVLSGVTDSVVAVSANGAEQAVLVKDNSTGNLIRLGKMLNVPTVADVKAGSNNNEFFGGRVPGSFLDGGTGNSFFGGIAAGEVSKTITTTTNAGGRVTISHDLTTTPSFISAMPTGSFNGYITCVQRGAASVIFEFHNHDGTVAANTSVGITYMLKV